MWLVPVGADVFERAFEHLRLNAPEQKEERVMLLEAWLDAERRAGRAGDAPAVERKMPKRVKRKRPITAEDGTPAGYAPFPLPLLPPLQETPLPSGRGWPAEHSADGTASALVLPDSTLLHALLFTSAPPS